VYVFGFRGSLKTSVEGHLSQTFLLDFVGLLIGLLMLNHV